MEEAEKPPPPCDGAYEAKLAASEKQRQRLEAAVKDMVEEIDDLRNLLQQTKDIPRIDCDDPCEAKLAESEKRRQELELSEKRLVLEVEETRRLLNHGKKAWEERAALVETLPTGTARSR